MWEFAGEIEKEYFGDSERHKKNLGVLESALCSKRHKTFNIN